MVILFDLDGTLIDSTEAILESFHNAFNFHSYPYPTDDEIKGLIGHPLDIMFVELGVPEEEVWDFVATYKKHYRIIALEKTELLDFAKEAIEKASKIAKLGIVTTKTGLYSQELMQHFGLMHHFEVLIGREHVDNPKPHEEPILKALQQLNIDKNVADIWMIGDTEMDLLSAKNASVNAIGVASGYDTKENLEKYSKIVLTDALAAVDFLSKH